MTSFTCFKTHVLVLIYIREIVSLIFSLHSLSVMLCFFRMKLLSSFRKKFCVYLKLGLTRFFIEYGCA